MQNFVARNTQAPDQLRPFHARAITATGPPPAGP
jgi:hypothetical protein